MQIKPRKEERLGPYWFSSGNSIPKSCYINKNDDSYYQIIKGVLYFQARSLKSGVLISLSVRLNAWEPQCRYLVFCEQGLVVASTIFQSAFSIALTLKASALIY